MKYRLWFLLFAVGPLIFSSACDLTPVIPRAPAPTATPTCRPPASNPSCQSGIMWGQSFIERSPGPPSSVWADVYLATNCLPNTTASVTMSGPTGSMPLTYSGPITWLGTTYSEYKNASTSLPLVPGDACTLTTVTSLGTATASGLLPPVPTMDPNGNFATWSGSSIYDFVVVEDTSFNPIWYSNLSCAPSSPVTIPASAYPSPGTYNDYVSCVNYTTNITNGHGVLSVENLDYKAVTK